ncbi:MAG: nucleotide exchange factor GrpE [Phycisphaerales bacterium]|nr:MAG: nucleotide exchange factor GrpE [Phycisphaerales bacterium]
MKKAKVKKARREQAAPDTTQTVESDDRAGPVDTAAGKGVETAKVKAKPEAKPVEKAAEQSDPLEELHKKVNKLEDSLLRTKADYQNAQRRAAIERGEAIRYANAEVMKSLLTVLDDFERSLAAAEDSNNLEAVVDGVRLVYGNLAKALRDHGLEVIDALHETFDPSVHQAMMPRPTSDYPPGTVVEEIAKGYRLYDRVLRPTKVVVSKALETEAETCDEGEEAAQSEGESKEE